MDCRRTRQSCRSGSGEDALIWAAVEAFKWQRASIWPGGPASAIHITRISVEVEEAVDPLGPAREHPQHRQREYGLGDGPEALVDDGVERHREDNRSAEDKKPGERYRGDSDGAVQCGRPREVVRKVELADRLHARDRRSNDDGAGQERAGRSEE